MVIPVRGPNWQPPTTPTRARPPLRQNVKHIARATAATCRSNPHPPPRNARRHWRIPRRRRRSLGGIKSAGSASDEHLSILETLFGKNMLRACKIVDERGVRRVTGAPSGRSLFLVMGESRRKEEYLCFPEHLCTCYSFFYDIVGRGEQLCCKHQLAARLAEAVGEHQEMEVTDEELAHMLVKL
ncbi:hypothetical protein EJB05_11485, partial [Eragrostis curvula]